MTTSSTTSSSLNSASLSQTFSITLPSGIKSVFVPSVDLFFSSASTSYGVNVMLVGVTNGLPDVTKPIKNASCSLDASEINVSNTTPIATNFQFPALVQLSSAKTYAIVISAFGPASDYSVWTARPGDTDLLTGTLVSSDPAVGTLYYAKNSQNWAEIAQEDLMYTVYRCSFLTNTSGVATFTKDPTEIMTLVSPSFLSGPVDIQAGDDVWGLSADRSAANTSVHGIVTGYDATNNLLYIRNSTGNFVSNNSIEIVRANLQSSDASYQTGALKCLSTIGVVFDVPADGIVPELTETTDSFCTLSSSFSGVTKPVSTAVPDSSPRTVQLQTEYEFKNSIRYIMSRSNEISQLGASKSSINLNLNLETQSDYTSPIVSLEGSSLIAYTNLINNDATGEWGNYGNASTRYIGKTVVLAEGMDAETIKAWTSAYVPPGTSVLCYARIENSSDVTAFDNCPWTLLTQTSNVGVYSDPTNSSNYIEFEFSLPTSQPSPYHGEAWNPSDPTGNLSPCTYTNSNGTFTNFKSYALKIVLLAPENATNYPRLDSARCIAMMV